jgi:serpin B
MKKNLASAFVIFLMLACSSKPNPIEPSQTKAAIKAESKTDAEKYMEPLKPNELAFQLFKLHSSEPANTNFSPLSLKMAFQLVYPGATENTKKTLETAFGFSIDQPNPFNAEIQLAAQSKSENSATKILIGNSVWVKDQSSILSKFKDALKTAGAELKTLNLNEMNSWVKNSTLGKIEKLFDALDSKTKLIALNTLYLKADWASPFTAEATIQAHFQSSPHGMITVKMMRQTSNYSYFEDATSQWLEMPYRDSPLVMTLVLPKKRFDLKSIEDSLSSKVMNAAISRFKPEQVELVLPKFKFESKKSMKTLLSEAGYSELFIGGGWGNLTKQNDLVISDVLQATALEVNEKGTEAAAATAIMMEKSSFGGIMKKSFYCDQPFLFFLRNSKSGEIYFMGKVYSPTQN